MDAIETVARRFKIPGMSGDDVLQEAHVAALLYPGDLAAVERHLNTLRLAALRESSRYAPLASDIEDSHIPDNIQDYLSILPPIQREILEHLFIYERTIDETADYMKLTYKSVESHRTRALKKLRDHLRENA